MISMVAPPTLWGEPDWPLRDPEVTRKELARLENMARALAPRVIVFRTPPAVRPGTVAFQRFLDVAARVKDLAPIRVWDPQGVWERQDARKAVHATGLLVTADPLRDPIEGEPVVYARMRGLGSDRRYHIGRMEDLAAALADTEEAFVVFDTPTGYAEAIRFARMLGGQERQEQPEHEHESGESQKELEEHKKDFERTYDGENEA